MLYRYSKKIFHFQIQRSDIIFIILCVLFPWMNEFIFRDVFSRVISFSYGQEFWVYYQILLSQKYSFFKELIVLYVYATNFLHLLKFASKLKSMTNLIGRWVKRSLERSSSN